MNARTPSGVVLVVEDEWLIRDEIVSWLRQAGWEVLETSTGEGAVGLIDGREHIDVLITDIQLAGYLSGWDVAEAFRATQPTLPVIYASGDMLDRSRAVANSLFFAKPYHADQILNACRKCVERSGGRPGPGGGVFSNE